MNSHYRTLEVDPEADPVAIRSAYLALMRRYHPDRGGEEADPARTQAVAAAWEVLRDPARRAAYDETRKTHFQPGGAVVRGPQARGGAAGRNLFLMLAAATLGLGWWAHQQPQPGPQVKVAATAARTDARRRIEPDIRPEADREAMHRRIMLDEPSAAPAPLREKVVDKPIEVPPPEPVSEQPRMPVRTAEAAAEAKGQPVSGRPAAMKVARSKVRAAAAVTPDPGGPRIDLEPLERHLRLLTDQSLRFGTAAKRTRLEITGETFVAQLRGCDDDACRRDAYLRRNAEIGDIMRNR